MCKRGKCNSLNSYPKEKQDYLYEIKLLLVGEGRVGKTSLVKSLTIPNYHLEDEQTTEGIDIEKWIIRLWQFLLKGCGVNNRR